MIKLAISGARGRMGQAIAKLADADPELTITALLEHTDHPEVGTENYGTHLTADNASIKGCDALIEFTLPDGTMTNLKAAAQYGVPMVIGTTGFSAQQLEAIKSAAKEIPIVLASNMSIGVNTLFKLIQIATGKIAPHTISISETHHIHKKDKPSGTAKTMAQIAEKASGLTIDNVESIREGEVIGDHTIRLESGEDVLTISHHAKDRSMFARGALTAAKYLQGKAPGLYTMQDVLGFTS
ncbi:MAG: 4-hydroxy-tetrahydrodipicolinate reductase [Candidatus Omnitrophica bacterium]|nr:4-hydroxy-tetrahydrodipicolinate reductase [Candidatus Omnitrophota bacterium]MCB9721821.1 4-hydroxy-tetrahydrodipicolinate reductase [Candidatus Omnitrophota bacterium]